MKTFTLVLISFSSLFATAAFGQTMDQNKSLQGLSGVFIVVQPVHEDATQDGLTQAHVQRVVEATLQKAGVSIAKQPQLKDGLANLIVTVDTIKSQGVYLFTVSVGVVQTVQLTRKSTVGVIPAQTWDVNVLGLTTPQRMDIIDQPLEEEVGKFALAFKMANPK